MKTFDKSEFTNSPYVRKASKPWGYELHFVPDKKPYMGKIIHINAGRRLSLQVHDQKQETWYILAGNARVMWDNANGDLVETNLVYGKGYSCGIGQRHRLVGVTNCDIVEVSTPEIGTTYRLEDDYNRQDETEKIRSKERSKI